MNNPNQNQDIQFIGTETNFERIDIQQPNIFAFNAPYNALDMVNLEKTTIFEKPEPMLFIN